FFQAEDGIRDFHVTGVQTCALPISLEGDNLRERRRPLAAVLPHSFVQLAVYFRPHGIEPGNGVDALVGVFEGYNGNPFVLRPGRSEERRVGQVLWSW